MFLSRHMMRFLQAMLIGKKHGHQAVMHYMALVKTFKIFSKSLKMILKKIMLNGSLADVVLWDSFKPCWLVKYMSTRALFCIIWPLWVNICLLIVKRYWSSGLVKNMVYLNNLMNTGGHIVYPSFMKFHQNTKSSFCLRLGEKKKGHSIKLNMDHKIARWSKFNDFPCSCFPTVYLSATFM